MINSLNSLTSVANLLVPLPDAAKQEEEALALEIQEQYQEIYKLKNVSGIFGHRAYCFGRFSVGFDYRPLSSGVVIVSANF